MILIFSSPVVRRKSERRKRRICCLRICPSPPMLVGCRSVVLSSSAPTNSTTPTTPRTPTELLLTGWPGDGWVETTHKAGIRLINKVCPAFRQGIIIHYQWTLPFERSLTHGNWESGRENVDTIQMSLILGYNHYIVVVVVVSNKRLSQVSTQERTIADEATISASIFLAAGQLMFEKLLRIAVRKLCRTLQFSKWWYLSWLIGFLLH